MKRGEYVRNSGGPTVVDTVKLTGRKVTTVDLAAADEP